MAASKKKDEGKPVTFADCVKVGLGQLRLDPTAFYDMTFNDFLLAADGFHRLEEVRQQQEWERTRWQTLLLLSPHTKKGHRLKPTDLCTFPWEKATKKKRSNKLLEKELKRISNGQAR